MPILVLLLTQQHLCQAAYLFLMGNKHSLLTSSNAAYHKSRAPINAIYCRAPNNLTTPCALRKSYYLRKIRSLKAKRPHGILKTERISKALEQTANITDRKWKIIKADTNTIFPIHQKHNTTMLLLSQFNAFIFPFIFMLLSTCHSPSIIL